MIPLLPRLFAYCLPLLFSFSGCGFHLRGVVEIPPDLNPLYIQAKPGSRVRSALLDRLQGSQVRPAKSAEAARVIVRILQESKASRVTAVDENNKVVASELFLHLRFDATDGQGKTLVPVQSLQLSRTYENPDVQVLGKEQEANLIYEDLAQEGAERILYRLRAALL